MLDLFPPVPDRVEPVAHRETLWVDPCVSWCECVALIRQLVKLQEACDAKANHSCRGVMNAMDERDEEKMGAKAQKYWSHLAWMTTVRYQVEDFGMVNAVTNPVVQAVQKMDLSFWLPSRELSSSSDYADFTTAIPGLLQGFLREDEGRHPRRRPRGCRPRHWTRRIRALVEGVVQGVKAVALDCVLKFWSPLRPGHRGQEALA